MQRLMRWWRSVMLQYVILFFLSGAGDHRDLHSFPTRRSFRSRTGGARLAAELDESARGGRRTEELAHLVVEPLDDRRRRDRKSTRLNSSHGYISYAVFCLKKKKQDHHDLSDTEACPQRIVRRL